MKRSIATKDLASVIEGSLLRNLNILVEQNSVARLNSLGESRTVLDAMDVREMLKACAANLAMVLNES